MPSEARPGPGSETPRMAGFLVMMETARAMVGSASRARSSAERMAQLDPADATALPQAHARFFGSDQLPAVAQPFLGREASVLPRKPPARRGSRSGRTACFPVTRRPCVPSAAAAAVPGIGADPPRRPSRRRRRAAGGPSPPDAPTFPPAGSSSRLREVLYRRHRIRNRISRSLNRLARSVNRITANRDDAFRFADRPKRTASTSLIRQVNSSGLCISACRRSSR
jgi:hypothetical protein